MKRFPYLLILGLLTMWLILSNSVSPGQVTLGAVLAIVAVLAFGNMRPLVPHLHRPRTVLRLMFIVLIDVVRSNIGVARVILGLIRDRPVRSGFLRIPLDLRDPHGVAALAAIVTSTPGTVWADFTPDRSTLTLHVLDLQDEAALVRTIKERYERPLMEIFE